MVLLAFPMGVISVYDIIIAPSEVGPDGVTFDIRDQKELAVLIRGSLDDFVNDPQGNGFDASIGVLVIDLLPRGSNIYGFTITRMTDIFAAFLDGIKPLLLGLRSTKVSFDNEPGAVFDEDPEIFSGIVSGVESDKKGDFYYCITLLKKGFAFQRSEEQRIRARRSSIVTKVLLALLGAAVTIVLTRVIAPLLF